MSKEIAQTVGGKRIAWLIAIMAAFTVFATVGSQWRTADAAFLQSPTITSSPSGGPASVGTVVTFTATAAYDGTAMSAPITVSIPAGYTDIGTGVPSCSSGAGTASVALVPPSSTTGPATAGCTITQAGATGGTATYTISARIAGTGTVAGASLTAPFAAGPTPSFTVSAATSLTKVNSPATISRLGGSGTSTITFTNNSAFPTSAGVTLHDNITTAGLTIGAGTPAGFTACASVNPVGWPGVAITTTATTVLTCTSSAAVAAGASVSLVIPFTAPANPALTNVVYNDTASADDVTINGVLVTTAATANQTVTVAGVGNVELRHIADNGTIITVKDVFNNVRGSSHTICTVNNAGAVDTATLVPELTVNSFVVTASGGYNGPAVVGPQSPTFTDPQLFTGTGANGGLAGATCLSYISTGAGDQQISAEFVPTGGTTNITIDWDTNDDGNGGVSPLNDALVKEWNVLEGSTLGGGVSGSGENIVVTKTIPVQLNPATGLFTFTPLSITDVFFGSHVNGAGATQNVASLAGVAWTVSLSGCGVLAGDLSGTTTLTSPNGDVGNTPNVTFSNLNCGPASTASITFRGSEPANLGSGVGRTVTETININFSVVIPTKQVFLAWAGQRIILEHDWRLNPGDVDGGLDSSVAPITGSSCSVPIEDRQSNSFTVKYLKGSGPGNFLPALGTVSNPVVVSGNDQAVVTVNGDDGGDFSQTDGSDIVAEPNDSCISRVLYESEDPGEVDIEAFIDTIAGGPSGAVGASKVAFVVYYMKLNTVGVSLVSSVAKPLHNATGTDYAPGNPWDASKDVTAVDWNVSKDLLVRGRVTGWFLNSNPSGRAADTSDPLNVLPANRWVMPNDWALLAGGPADNADNSAAIGTAEQFRPQYDIMINPARGNRGLDTPEGTILSQSTTLGADLTATGTTVTIKLPQSSVYTIGIGSRIRVDNEDMDVTTVVTPNALGTLGTFTVNRGQGGTAPAAHTTGAIVLLYTNIVVPFEGPFSLLDLPPLGASAALSDWDPNNVRDTMWKDGDVDWWDAPMPPALVTVDIRGTGFIKQVLKQDVYYNGTANSTAGQTYPNPYYIVDIPDSPWIASIAAGGGYAWDTWGTDGPGGNGQGVYRFWTAIPGYANATTAGVNPASVGDSSVSSSQATELAAIEAAYKDTTIGRTLVVYSDNHGEFMVTANGDFKTDLSACASSPLGGASSKHCKPGDKVGAGSIYATADYQDFRGKHFPVKSNVATVTWLWGGYKDVTVEPGETDQFKYVVFHGLDRDGFCSAASFGAVSLHPVLSGAANDTFNGNPAETVDFLIDSGEGIIIGSSSSAAVNVTKQFATGATTFSTLLNDPAVTGIKEFPLSSLAATGATDECQTWIRVSNSLLGILNILVIAHDDTAEGDIGFDKIIDLTNTTSYTLNFRWSLVTWAGANDIAVADALKGTGTTGKNPGGNDISASVTAVYGWDQAAQQWLGYFPTGVNVPGANDLTTLKTGQAYWIAITGPGSVTWTVATNVN